MIGENSMLVRLPFGVRWNAWSVWKKVGMPVACMWKNIIIKKKKKKGGKGAFQFIAYLFRVSVRLYYTFTFGWYRVTMMSRWSPMTEQLG